MSLLAPADPLAAAVVGALRTGDLDSLTGLLEQHPGLVEARVGGEDTSRTLLHVVTDWPGHFPRVAETVAALTAAGADPDARFHGPHRETPLHWAASTDDARAVDALLDAGADIDAPGAVIAGGTPLQDARAFRSWAAADRLVSRGARVDLADAAALGMTDVVGAALTTGSVARGEQLDLLLWHACHGGRLDTARRLHEAGADPDVVAPWEPQTPLDAAAGSGNPDVVTWLHGLGARLHDQLPGGCLA